MSMYTRPDWVRRLAAMGPSVGGARELVALDADELIATARRTTGLDNFGPPTWEEPFRRLVAALDGEAQLHTLGRLMCRHDALRHLRTRLFVIDALARQPAIAGETIRAPVVVTGPSRSGTSILQELLALDPQLRAPLAFEMAFPVPASELDQPVEWAETEFDLWGDVQPEFRAVHELDARLPEECVWLLAPEFDLAFWSTCTNLPQWSAWRAGTDPLPAYRFHRMMLQVLQHGDAAPGTRRAWALKSPAHLARLPALFSVYPDARVIHTHRDPVKTIPSTASTVYTGRWLRSDAVDPVTIGQTVGIGLEMMMVGAMEIRRRGEVPDDRIADLHYLDLLRDPVTAVGKVYDQLDLPFVDSMPDRIHRYLDTRPQHKYGLHRYRSEDFGLDLDEIRSRFAPYTDYYGVEPEG